MNDQYNFTPVFWEVAPVSETTKLFKGLVHSHIHIHTHTHTQTNMDPTHPGFPVTITVLWVLKSSVPVFCKITTGMPHDPGLCKS